MWSLIVFLLFFSCMHYSLINSNIISSIYFGFCQLCSLLLLVDAVLLESMMSRQVYVDFGWLGYLIIFTLIFKCNNIWYEEDD